MDHCKKIFVLHASAAMGGAEYSLLEFLCNLHDMPVEIHMASSSRSMLPVAELNIPVQFHNIRLNYLKKKYSLKQFIGELKLLVACNLKLYRLIRKHTIKTVYCNTFRTLPYCILLRLLSRTRIICHCRDNIQNKWLAYFIICISNKCIAVSEKVKTQLSAHPKVKVIHNGINSSFFTERKYNGWVHKKLNLALNTQLIGNIGQIVAWKNQMDFVLIANELIKKNSKLHFLIIGGAVDKNYFCQLQQQIIHLNLSSYFSITGQVDHVKDYLSGLDILVHTAKDEPFGRILVEAAAMSKPVISYASGGPSEIIIDGKTGFLVEDGNITRMVELTSRLLNDPSLRHSLGQSAQAHAAEYFNADAYAGKVCNILLHD